ncbi:phospholipid-transporting ATPase ABCA3-like [Gigantopelta aegis]|uniref:phospholipid-transporting ATPase ABCA3-like n=1 Tax=Gigantopelta aegis TaxID=1735272 RepID=UPI001B88CA1F|nr:phospholipid-transporting ATPase ABCA3-like [Gigantopelta aegis]
MAFGRQVGLLLWKNFVLQKRKICVSVFEVALPVFFAVVMLLIRFLVKKEEFTQPTLYPSIDVTDKHYNEFEDNTGRSILFSPNNTLVTGIMNDVTNLALSKGVNVTSQGFGNSNELEKYYQSLSKTSSVAIGVQFDNVDFGDSVLPLHVDISFRPRIISETDSWETKRTFQFFQQGRPRDTSSPKYLQSGFLFIQYMVNEAVIRQWNSSAGVYFDNLMVFLQRIPYSPYVRDPILTVTQNWFSLFIMLSFILSAIQTTKGLVYEKERKLKESMKLMGLSSTAHWTSWLITSFILLVIIITVYVILCCAPIAKNGPVLTNTDPSVFFVFLLCYGISVIAFCFMISVFIQRANVAAAVSGIFFFLAYLPWFFLKAQYEDMTQTAKLGTSVVFNMAMTFGLVSIGLYEGTGAGAQWSNIAEPASVDDNYSLLDSMLMLLGDSAIYFLITWYVDNVKPGEFGVPRPWYFPFTSSYWCSTQVTKSHHDAKNTNDPKHFETEPTGLTAGISIKNLTKEFKMGPRKIKAVNNLNVNFFRDQISVLLGHNGAGKTTTMSMLTGFIPPSCGTAVVNDYDINTDINHVRRSLGLCPQHNILFDTMTVLEHLEFFASLKNVPRRKVREEAIIMAREVGLEHKADTLSMHLSGGQKRKLSVGIALIGGSEIVILDEPTSGMDPAARRQTWDILQRNKHGRTLVLTTHFMDEADLLGDRISIMAEGVVKCCGSSMFLKKLYGTGYHLVIVKGSACVVSQVTAVIQDIVPSAELESEINSELSYLLPDDQSHLFPNLFDQIDANKDSLGIISFGTTATTMEEVFLKVGENAEHTDKEDEPNRPRPGSSKMGFVNPAWESDEVTINKTSNGTANGNDSFLAFNTFHRLRGVSVQLQRFKALFIKKALHTRRNLIIGLVQVLLPVIATIFALVVDKIAPTDFSEVSLKLDLEPFESTIVPYTDGLSPSATTTSLAQHYSGLFSNNNVPDKIDRAKYPNMTKYFMDKVAAMGIATFNKHVVIGGEFEPVNTSTTSGTALFNGQPFHGQPIALSYLMNSIASLLTSGVDHSITAYNNPLPKNLTDFAAVSNQNAITFGFTISFNIMFGMAFLTASFVFFLIKERLIGSKHLQFVSGVGPLVFWMSNLAWDFINYVIPCFILLPVFAAFQTDAYVLDGRLGLVFLSLVLYGWAVLPFMYLLQYLFKSPATGMVVAIIFNILTGLTTLLVVMILQIPSLGAVDVSDALDWVFLVIFPHYCLGKSFMDIYTNYVNTKTCNKLDYKVVCQRVAMPCCKGNCGSDFCILFSENYFDWEAPGVGRELVFMILQGFLYLGLVLLIEYHVPQRVWYAIRSNHDDIICPPNAVYNVSGQNENCAIWNRGSPVQEEDGDVLEENNRINNTSLDKLSETDSLILTRLYKRFGSLVAVNHISVGIPQKECFGLLGQNGAGKTTTFKMLTGEMMVTGGNAYLKQYDIKNTLDKVHENMGYCPQFDALIDQMTGRETLYMYSRLKGVPENQVADTVNALIDMMLLVPHADKQTSQYSGGNKRKLSTAISLVGDPSFILLDEPSTGMDPKARRQLWNVLSRVRAFGKTLILTSHSMEECEALCTRVAIMVNGRFRCLGSPQHLKSKFGEGYTLIARMTTLPDGTIAPTEPLVAFIRSQFPSAIVFDDHQGYVHFQVPDADVRIAHVFTVMERSKTEFSVEDYSVHQTTLEQVFLTFTREQTVSTHDNTSLRKRLCCC